MVLTILQYRALATIKNYRPVHGEDPRTADLCRLLVSGLRPMAARLTSLCAADLIDREKRRWRITPKGERALERWRAEVSRAIAETTEQATEAA